MEDQMELRRTGRRVAATERARGRAFGGREEEDRPGEQRERKIKACHGFAAEEEIRGTRNGKEKKKGEKEKNAEDEETSARAASG